MNRKGLYAGAATLMAAFALAAAAEWNGYHAFDQPGGFNMLCALDPACRRLTAGETAMARSVFGEEINYKSVKIFSRPHFGLPLPGFFAMSPNGNIYVSSTKSPDYSAASQTLQSSFMHEMTHVWQVQKGMDVRQKAADTMIANGFNYWAAYQYNIDRHDDFYDFNFEQQAEIVESYYLERDVIRAQMADYRSDPATIIGSHQLATLREGCKTLIPLENKLAQEFPVRAELACQFIRDEKPRVLKPRKKHRMSPA